MIHALLIDLDGVLRLWNATDRRAEELTGLPPGAIRRVAFTHDLLLPAITGHITDDDWRSSITNRLRTEFPQADVARAVRIWSASPGTIDPSVLNLIRRCRQNATVLLITNATSRLTADLARLAVLHEFDGIVNSSAVGAPKPQPAIFRAALQTAQRAAHETLFVDDTPGHVAAATQLGMHGHLYQGSDHLNTVLRAHGVV